MGSSNIQQFNSDLKRTIRQRRQLSQWAYGNLPRPQIGGQFSPTLPICSADSLGFWILLICFADLLGFLGQLRSKWSEMCII